MAILEKIRNRSIILILVIGLALFAFIVSDLIGRGDFSGPSRASSMGTVNGVEMPLDAFRTRVENISKNNPDLPLMQVVNDVWESELTRLVYETQCEAAGMKISKAHFAEQLKTNSFYNSLSEFKGDNGLFSLDKYALYLEDLKVNNPDHYQQWKQQETYLLQESKKNLYTQLIDAGLFTTTLEGKLYHKWKNKRAAFNYVFIPYTVVADSTILISKGELKDYIQDHKAAYQQEERRDLSFVYLKETPSPADIQVARDELTALLKTQTVFNATTQRDETIPGFSEVTDLRSFINANSDTPYNDKYLFENQLPNKELLTKPIVGPYRVGKALLLSRLLGKKKLFDSLEVKHIIIPYLGSKLATATTVLSKADAKKYADSLFRLVADNEEKFAALASQINTDKTKEDKGNLGWVVYSQLTADNFDSEYASRLFTDLSPTTKVIETSSAIYITVFLNRRELTEGYQVATVSRTLYPSSETINTLFMKATQFEMNVTELKKPFNEQADSIDLKVEKASKLTELSHRLGPYANQRTVIKWAFESGAKLESIKRFNSTDGYIIAKVTGVKNAGTMSAEDARPQIEPILIKKKKVEKIKALYADLTIEEAAKKLATNVRTQPAVTLGNPNIESIGLEPKVVGTVFSLSENETALVDGEKGVFKIKVLTHSPAEKTTDETYADYRKLIRAQAVSASARNVIKALKEHSEITDNRSLFY